MNRAQLSRYLPALVTLSGISDGFTANRTQQAGWQQRGALCEGIPGSPGYSLLWWQGLVSNQTIWPEIGDSDLQGVFAGFHNMGDVQLEWCPPEDAQVLAIEFHLRHDIDLAKAKRQFRIFGFEL